MAKRTTSFRASESTQSKMSELGDIFRESGAEIIERAIDFLYENREQQAKSDLEKRLKSVKKAQ